MTRAKKIILNVQCAFDPNHIFEKAYTIQEGTEDRESKVEAYCPFCDKMVSITIQGKPVPDKELLRRFGPEDIS